jgi:hypothetical protein
MFFCSVQRYNNYFNPPKYILFILKLFYFRPPVQIILIMFGSHLHRRLAQRSSNNDWLSQTNSTQRHCAQLQSIKKPLSGFLILLYYEVIFFVQFVSNTFELQTNYNIIIIPISHIVLVTIDNIITLV